MRENRQRRDRIRAKVDLLCDAAVAFCDSDRSDAGSLFDAAAAYARAVKPEPKKSKAEPVVHGVPQRDMRETFCGLDATTLKHVPFSHPVNYISVSCSACRRVIQAMVMKENAEQ